jgi:hypothetical protein
MKALRSFALIILMALLIFINMALQTQPTLAEDQYSAGKKMTNDEGQFIGCDCPVKKGSCVCKYSETEGDDWDIW